LKLVADRATKVSISAFQFDVIEIRSLKTIKFLAN